MVNYAGYIGSILAFSALAIPMKIGEGTIRISSSDMLNQEVILARLTTRAASLAMGGGRLDSFFFVLWGSDSPDSPSATPGPNQRKIYKSIRQ